LLDRRAPLPSLQAGQVAEYVIEGPLCRSSKKACAGSDLFPEERPAFVKVASVGLPFLIGGLGPKGIFVCAFKRVPGSLFGQTLSNRFSHLRFKPRDLRDHVGNGFAAALPIHVLVVCQSFFARIGWRGAKVLLNDTLDALGQFL
jgi:hypothetical protein